MSARDDYLARIGTLIRDARQHSGLTQSELATELRTSQSAVNRIEKGQQNLTLEMIARIGTALDSEIVSVGTSSGPSHLRVKGGTQLSGAIDVKSSKNAGVALLCASLLNEGTTILRKVARIEEVNRLLEVLSSIGVRPRWLGDEGDLELVVPAQLDLAAMDEAAARRTRSIADAARRPPANGARYASGDTGRAMAHAAGLVTSGLGVRAIAIDAGGWDHHIGLRWNVASRIEELATNLAAFFTDLGPAADRVTLVTMSEFGRRLRENGANGVDHGYGSCVLLMGAGVKGDVSGVFPGLVQRPLGVMA